MRLVSFSVTNYRSITKTHELPLFDATVLLGQNNEGKSNLLSALATAMTVVSQLAQTRLFQGRLLNVHRHSEIYEWARDFPISLQPDHPDGESTFRLKFRLNEDERAEFKATIGSSLNEELPIEISLGKRDPAFRVKKKGPGSGPLNSKAQQIANFIGEHVDFTHVPAVRTAGAANEIVRDMVGRSLRSLLSDKHYTDAIAKLAALEKPALELIATRIRDALKLFLPQIKAVELRAPDDSRYRAFRRAIEIVVDDGTATLLERKGDGVQSLVALGLLRGVSPSEKDLILALEEPESHLHPSAIHRLRDVIDELSHKHQVVLTTHCPLFVNRIHIDRNIIVSGSKARAAKSIREIRDVLGVRASDNLIHANLVLVVEGETDAKAMKAILGNESSTLKNAFRGGNLVIDHLGGSGKLNYKLTELTNALCAYHVCLDNDDAGKEAEKRAREEGLLKPADVHLLICQGKTVSEWEDLVDIQIYSEKIQQTYGVDLRGSHFRNAKVWSDRTKDTFRNSGKPWDTKIEKEIKSMIAELIQKTPQGALNPKTRSAFDHLRDALEEKVTTIQTR